MATRLTLSSELYDYLKLNRITPVSRSKIFRFGRKGDELAYKHLLDNFRK
jgi:hypothetical protein